MGLFEKLKNGLKNTKDALASKITGVINSFTKIDEDFFEELEETLILSDIGAVTSANICEALRKEVKATGTTDPAEVKGLLKKIIAGILEGENELILDTKPTVILVIGVNGAGKTTVFNMLTGVYKPSKGVITLDGENITGKSTRDINRAGIARTFQNIRLFKEMSVLDNVKVGLHNHYKYSTAEGVFRLPRFFSTEKEMDKKAMELLGWKVGDLRLPLVEPSEEHIAYIKRELENAGCKI